MIANHPAKTVLASNVESDWTVCRDIARDYGKSFYLASHALSAPRRRAIHAAYAFCRIADDIVDRAPANRPDLASQALDDLERELDEPRHPVMRAFHAARQEYGLPDEAIRELLAGVRGDLSPRTYRNWMELKGYCYAVAGTVGLIVAPILGCRDAAALQYAAKLGIAMQLTNVLRDVREDAEQGRLYLPLDELAEFDCSPKSVLGGCPTGAFPEFMAFQINRARLLYADAERGIPALDFPGRLASLAASRFYAGILREIEKQNFDVFATRAHVSTRRKVRSIPGVAFAAATYPLIRGSYRG
jgi:phytoene synthase